MGSNTLFATYLATRRHRYRGIGGGQKELTFREQVLKVNDEDRTMIIEELKEQECQEILERNSLGRLGCALDDQPYVVPVHFEYEPNYLYLFSTEGKKIEWMRANAKVCVEVEEIASATDWVTVIVNGRYEELHEGQFPVERTHARELLGKQEKWWLNALAERRLRVQDAVVSPIFFRIRIDALSGLRGSSAG